MTLTPGQKKIAIGVGILLALVAVWWFFIRKPKPDAAKTGKMSDANKKKLDEFKKELADCLKRGELEKRKPGGEDPCKAIQDKIKKVEEESGWTYHKGTYVPPAGL